MQVSVVQFRPWAPSPSSRNPLTSLASIARQAGSLDLGPFRDVVGDDAAEVRWRARDRSAAQIRKPRTDGGIGCGRVGSRLSLSMISTGVFLGTTKPLQELAS
jgi:hypothetical protein